jgi:Ca-activated chloride channel homolog
MNLLWSWSLLLLWLIPILLVLYIWMLKRKRKHALHYSTLVLIRQALPQQSRYKRHLPFALFVLALTSLVFALGRPVAHTTVPDGHATVILAIDVSRSMLQADIPPNRLNAAMDAALSFIRSRASNTQIGIVAFSGFAQLIQVPTTDQKELEAKVKSLTTGRRTSIGAGILESLDAIAEVNQEVWGIGSEVEGGIGSIPRTDGSYVPDIIVLLTDGVHSTGPMPLEAAQEAAERGVRIYTIGFGTEEGSFLHYGGGGGFRRGIDEATLIEIAAITGGEYYSATSSGELQKVFESLPSYLSLRQETTEISVYFATIGAFLAALALLLSLLWNPLP